MQKCFSWMLLILTCCAVSAQATPTTEQVQALISASEKARQRHATQEDIEHFLGFFAEDLIDTHVSFNRSFTGKVHLRKGIPEKAKAMVSLSEELESAVLGTHTAVAVVREASKYYKHEQLKHFKGRTILVLEFNKDGLIQHMRRYLD
ncbi:hypothetical protein KJY73_02090 [Bowmanella sp. Y26]|uniref:hypothetical protein n=1 Tax=Bowmanella yangjiangensis TaxID=2811230 RepID=UPI001BDC832A|nr:hypothetical protein [Bowmanella yangjiangensis]MBT1062340.1 hypothetical protein [Bowmanella yangjiangensis]